MTRATDDQIARLLQLDPSETGSGFDVPDRARAVQHVETPQGRADECRRDADRAYRNWRLALVFCAACTAAIIAMLAGMAVLHMMTVAAAALADPLAGNPY